MPQDHAFDLVSRVNLQELRNALQQAQKEVATRFDFKGSSASVLFEEQPPVLKVTGDDQAQLRSVVDVVQGKLAKRGVPQGAFVWQPPEHLPSGAMKQQATLQQGIAADQARELVKFIKGMGLKVQPRIDGDTVRVSGRQLDELQTVIQAVKGKDFGVPLQAENYR